MCVVHVVNLRANSGRNRCFFAISSESSFVNELEEVNAADYIPVTDQRLDQIQRLTHQDTTLQTLKSTILAGWPEQREDTPVCIRNYWNFREELTVQNGVLYKGCRVIVPPALKSEMLERIHASHLGADACVRKARDALYWPYMSNDIKDYVSVCGTCGEFASKQRKEPLFFCNLK